MSTCIRIFPDCKGYILGSIEGRVAIQYFQEQQHQNYIRNV